MSTYKYIALVLMAVAIVLPVTFAATLSGPTPIPNPPKSSVVIVNPILCRGETNYMPVNITNLGNVASNITQMQNMQIGIAQVNGNGMYFEGNGSVNGGNINPGQSTIVYLPIFVSQSAPSFVQANIFFTFGYYDLYTDSEVLNATLTTESCNIPLSINVSPSVLTAGIMQNLSINFTNTGNTTLNHISASIGLPGSAGVLLSSKPISISSIAPKSNVHINEGLYISKNASMTIPLNISAVYYNGTRLSQMSETLLMLSTGIINFTASSFSISPALPSPSSIFSISFVLTDTGTVGATGVTVTPVLPKGFTPFGPSSTFVGDISPDTQTPVTVSIEASNAIKSGSYTIPIRINYLNALRQNLTTWTNDTVVIGAPAAFSTSQYVTRRASGSSGYLYLTIILVIIIIALLYLYVKERKAHRRSR